MFARFFRKVYQVTRNWVCAFGSFFETPKWILVKFAIANYFNGYRLNFIFVSACDGTATI
jgi:hypothetical protein